MVDVNQTPAAPEFAASDSEDRLIRLSNYKGNKNVVLVFNRGFF